MFFALLAVPSSLPLPVPGYSAPFALLMLPMAIQMLRGRTEPWFPEKMRRKPIKAKADGRALRAITRFIRFFERFLHPRGVHLYRTTRFQRVQSVFVLLCLTSMLLPIPFAHTLPAMGIFFMGLGLIEEDAAFGFGGILVALMGLALTGATLIAIFWLWGQYGPDSLRIVEEWIKGLFTAG